MKEIKNDVKDSEKKSKLFDKVRQNKEMKTEKSQNLLAMGRK